MQDTRCTHVFTHTIRTILIVSLSVLTLPTTHCTEFHVHVKTRIRTVTRQPLLAFVGVQTSFSSMLRRQMLRSTWFPASPEALDEYAVCFLCEEACATRPLQTVLLVVAHIHTPPQHPLSLSYTLSTTHTHTVCTYSIRLQQQQQVMLRFIIGYSQDGDAMLSLDAEAQAHGGFLRLAVEVCGCGCGCLYVFIWVLAPCTTQVPQHPHAPHTQLPPHVPQHPHTHLPRSAIPASPSRHFSFCVQHCYDTMPSLSSKQTMTCMSTYKGCRWW